MATTERPPARPAAAPTGERPAAHPPTTPAAPAGTTAPAAPAAPAGTAAPAAPAAPAGTAAPAAPAALVGPTTPATERPGDDAAALVPDALRVSAALGWRVLVVAAALYVLGVVVGYLAAIVVPIAIALLLAALLSPAVGRLEAWRVPRSVATAIVMIGGLAGVGAMLTFVVRTFVTGLPDLLDQLSASVNAVTSWLTTGPLQLSASEMLGARDQVLAALSANQASITAGALTTAATVGQLLTEFLLVVFVLIFFLYGGEQIWSFLISAVPGRVRNRVNVAGRRGVAALVSYVRATTIVATVDAVVIGVALGILGVPLAFSLAALVFLGAFVPIIGAVVAGTVAVLVAFVANGVVSALIVLAVVVGVMQLEGHVLQPILLGRAVKLHPLAVVLVIATGLLVGGIAGALLAVPLLAVLNSGVRSLRSEADQHVNPDDVRTSEPEATGPDDPDLEREPTLT